MVKYQNYKNKLILTREMRKRMVSKTRKSGKQFKHVKKKQSKKYKM